jgi:hypothetical protein
MNPGFSFIQELIRRCPPGCQLEIRYNSETQFFDVAPDNHFTILRKLRFLRPMATNFACAFRLDEKEIAACEDEFLYCWVDAAHFRFTKEEQASWEEKGIIFHEQQ